MFLVGFILVVSFCIGLCLVSVVIYMVSHFIDQVLLITLNLIMTPSIAMDAPFDKVTLYQVTGNVSFPVGTNSALHGLIALDRNIPVSSACNSGWHPVIVDMHCLYRGIVDPTVVTASMFA